MLDVRSQRLKTLLLEESEVAQRLGHLSALSACVTSVCAWEFPTSKQRPLEGPLRSPLEYLGAL